MAQTMPRDYSIPMLFPNAADPLRHAPTGTRLAQNDAERAIRQDPQFADAYALKATASLVQRDYSRAYAVAEKAVRIDPTDEKAWVIVATAENYLGQYEKAAAALARDAESFGAGRNVSAGCVIFFVADCWRSATERTRRVGACHSPGEVVRAACAPSPAGQVCAIPGQPSANTVAMQPQIAPLRMIPKLVLVTWCFLPCCSFAG